MDQQILDRLNRQLADNLGHNPHGEPLYCWKHTRDLLFWFRDTEHLVQRGSLYVYEPVYEQVRQTEQDYWTVAAWTPPPSIDEWTERHKGEVPWPAKGWYWASNVALEANVEPTEQFTQAVIAAIKEKRKQIRTPELAAEFFDSRLKKREQDEEERVRDWVEDRWTAFNNVPGSRAGSVSFGGI